jgi:hypothetical protein
MAEQLQNEWKPSPSMMLEGVKELVDVKKE